MKYTLEGKEAQTLIQKALFREFEDVMTAASIGMKRAILHTKIAVKDGGWYITWWVEDEA